MLKEQGLAPAPMEFRFKRRPPHLFDRLQPGGDRRKRRFGLADRQPGPKWRHYLWRSEQCARRQCLIRYALSKGS
jgi:hypothetical protein